MATSVKLTLRLSAQERAELLRRAAALAPGMTAAEWARRVLFRAAGLPESRAARPEGRPPRPRSTV